MGEGESDVGGKGFLLTYGSHHFGHGGGSREECAGMAGLVHVAR